MKRIVAVWLIAGLVLPSLVWAQDFLSRGEIYDFQSGDEFHFLRYACCNEDRFGVEKIVIHKRLELDEGIQYIRSISLFEFLHSTPPILTDTLFFKIPDTVIIEDIHYIPFDSGDAVFSDPETFHGRTVCTDFFFITNTFGEARYAQGLGKVYLAWRTPPDSSFHLADSLIYYKKGEESWGTPLLSAASQYKHTRIGIYPNPFSSTFRIQWEFPANSSMRIQIFDALGQPAWDRTTHDPRNELDCSGLKNGLYFIYLSSADKTYTGKIIKR